ncbi:unnamed protein product [Rotaria magnacalcarata]|uniref:Coiled-coil domain-containing protein 66 n=2 Tax=Rotaria magnacalcarata TaxID=392030 RepID=A0A816ZFU5_9BILA|nr:unnamed protein product [Rotaria magnacalcarata]CAF3920239.1 unnamed protein product [Rotaria magnacalcarata]
MAAATAIKSGSVEGGMQFRTQMVNGKPQIYFDAIDESSTKPRPKRSGLATNATRPPEPPKYKPSSQKPPSQNQTNKVTKKKQKVTFSEAGPTAGMFMTMDEISELVKTVQETTRAQSTIMNENNVPKNSSLRSTQQQEPSSSSQQQQFYQASSTAVVPNLDLSQQQPPPSFSQPLAPISPRQEALGMMADKKRQKWMREKVEMDRMKLEVEYDQLKHQLSPMHQKASSSPERSAYPPGDFSSNNKPPLPPSMKQNDNQQNDLGKTRLMEKKQQQWKQENAEKAPVWNPFGRPGAGAPMSNELQQKPSQPLSNIAMPYRPPDTSSIQTNIVLNDQTHVPAAMRTNLLFGDVRFEDDVKTAKEMERRQWLDDLQRQIEENKRKKSRDQETERRHDFLQDNIQPLVQEAANRHQQEKEKEPATPTTNTLGQNNTSGQNPTKSNRHESLVQHTYDKILEATELAKYEKKAQLIEKLKRNGHKTDLLAKTLPAANSNLPPVTQKVIEKNIDTSPRKHTIVKIEPLHFNIANDNQQSNRANDARRDEAVNTVNSTFRSDNSVQTDLQIAPHKQMFSFTREESDLPPQIPNHLLRNGKQNKKNVRIRSLEDTQRQRRPSISTTHSSHNTIDDGAGSQIGTHLSNYGTIDLVHRPLWNYQNPEHREYVPNSRRDPHYDKRPRQRNVEQENFERTDDVQKRTAYNRWNSDSELQQQQRKERKFTPSNRTRPAALKQNNINKNEPIPRAKPPHEASLVKKTDDESSYINISSLDKYEHFIPYTRTDDVLDPSKAFSPIPPSRETSAHTQQITTTTNDDHRRRQNASIQPPPYHVPPSRQEHILQQLTAIKENLVRRQQEVATSMNAIPV